MRPFVLRALAAACCTALGIGLSDGGALAAAPPSEFPAPDLKRADLKRADFKPSPLKRAQLAERAGDYRRAITLYCAAADQGYSDAAAAIGRFYLTGRGVPRNPDIAAAWLRLAAFEGNADAGTALRRLALQARLGPRVAASGCARRDATYAQVPPRPSTPAERRAVERLVAGIAPKYRIDPALVLAIIAVESDFQRDAVSPKNALGLMQLMPETAERFGVRNPFDAEENIAGGVRYLHWLLGYFEGRVPLVLAGYNAGEGAVERYGGVPPFPEMRDYISRIRALYPYARHPYERVALR